MKLGLASLLGILLLRFAANAKYLPVLFDRQSQNQFLVSNKRKLPDTFIDSDGWVTENIPANSRVLVDGLHNLYYMPVNFDHTSWSNSADYDFLITSQSVDETSWQLVHTNSVGIRIYKKIPRVND